MIVPIHLPPAELHIHADRRLAFQVLTAFGARQEDGGSSAVLRNEGNRKLVEFHSIIPPTRRSKQRLCRTVEWVTLHEPDEILFEGVEGPLDLLQDRFQLQDVAGCTHFRYESIIGIAGGIAGWLKAQFFIRPVLSKFMREHALKLKRTIEERAKRSRVYPYRECGLGAQGSDRGRRRR